MVKGLGSHVILKYPKLVLMMLLLIVLSYTPFFMLHVLYMLLIIVDSG